MMNNEQLSKSFAESEDWEWLDGAVNQYGDRYSSVVSAFPSNHYEMGGQYTQSEDSNDLITPDLNDPATLRLILELIRRRLGAGWEAWVSMDHSGEHTFSAFDTINGVLMLFRGETEPLALWAAWESGMR